MHRLMRHAHHLCLLRPVAIIAVLAINLAHPFMHGFEGGSLDALIMQIDAWAMAISTAPLDDQR